jgi:hypothetical protein
MRNTRAAGLLPALALTAAAAGAAASQPATDAAARFGWLGSLAGACWRGEYPGGGGDTQCYEWQYGRYLRGTIAIESPANDGSTMKLMGDSVFDADAKSGRIRYSNWADVGNLAHGEAYYEGEILQFPDVKSRDEEPRTRSSWRRIDADTFEVARERRDDKGWNAELTVTYRRVAGLN